MFMHSKNMEVTGNTLNFITFAKLQSTLLYKLSSYKLFFGNLAMQSNDMQSKIFYHFLHSFTIFYFGFATVCTTNYLRTKSGAFRISVYSTLQIVVIHKELTFKLFHMNLQLLKIFISIHFFYKQHQK